MDFDTEKLDNLPSRSAMHRHARDGYNKGCRCAYCRDRGWHSSVDWDRVRRWLVSRMGRSMASVTHEFVNLDWLPPEKRTYSFLCEFVETNTYLDGKRVMVSRPPMSIYKGGDEAVEDTWQEVFYVHPTTGRLCHKPRNSRVRYYATEAARMAKWFRKLGDYDQLIKLDGVWYHVWSDPCEWAKIPSNKRYDPNKPLLYDKAQMKHHFFGPFDRRWIEYQWYRPAIHKVQLNSRQLRDHELTNDNSLPVWNICKKCGANNCPIHTDRDMECEGQKIS